MAKYCRLCKNKIGVLQDDYPLSKNYEKIRICYDCDDKKFVLFKYSEDKMNEKFVDSFEYFTGLLERMEDDIEAEKALICMLDEIDGSVETTKELINEAFEQKKKIQQKEAARVELIRKNRENFILTTGYNVEGYCITKYNKIVSGEIVLGSGFLSELSGQLNDFFGTNSNLFSDKIRQAKEIAQKNMIENALLEEANAIIGVDFDVMTIGNNMIAVSVNGTAVTIEKA